MKQTMAWALGSMALLLTGCAGANLKAVEEARDGAPPLPLAVLVERLPSGAVPPAGPAPDRIAQAMPVISSVLDDKLRTAGIALRSSPGASEPSGADGLCLHVDVEKVVPGNAYGRDLIGFGSGRSSIVTHVRLVEGREKPARTVLSFDVKSTSGSMPGVLLSGGPIGLAVRGSTTLVSEATSDGHKEIDRTTNAITKKLTAFYREQGWLPSASHGSPA